MEYIEGEAGQGWLALKKVFPHRVIKDIAKHLDVAYPLMAETEVDVKAEEKEKDEAMEGEWPLE